MNIKINYGTGVATLPISALSSLERANKADIKVLFQICADPYLMVSDSRESCISRISERTGLLAAQIEAALAFWRGTGVLDMDEGEHTEVFEINPSVSPKSNKYRSSSYTLVIILIPYI